MEENREILAQAEDLNFDALNFSRHMGRKAALSVITFYILKNLGIDQLPEMN